MASRAEITQLLQAWNQSDQGAIEKLVPLVYDELHRLAHRDMADDRRSQHPPSFPRLTRSARFENSA